MNILFLTLLGFDSLDDRNIYTDLLREFIKHGHNVYVISPVERRDNQDTHLIHENGAVILRLKIGNTQKTNIIEKGISTILIEPIFTKAIAKYFSDTVFDLVLYSTPPITFYKAIRFVKKRDRAKSYLLLKDIFPQNAVDLDMLTTYGLKSIVYKYFRKKEKKLYAISDRIGCMSPANVQYILKHNPDINPRKVEVCPNAIDVIDKSIDDNARVAIRNKYDIPINKEVYVYGGNLGKPQGIPFLIECLKQQSNDDVYFLIIGDGTEFNKLKDYISEYRPLNVKLMKRLPKEDYDLLVAACDVGMIFLDSRFTIPNFPSRMLSYMQAKLPILAATDKSTDVGQIIEDGDLGWWCESNSVTQFLAILEKDKSKINKTAIFDYLLKNYSVTKVYETIIKGFYS